MRQMKVSMFTKEYPPNIYGGAGIHVQYLTEALSRKIKVEVRAFGRQDEDRPNLRIKGYSDWTAVATGCDNPSIAKVLSPLSVNLAFFTDTITADIVHCHTWYTFLAGFLAKRLYGIPLVTTIHSLEPLRPWKREQLGSAYEVSSWMEEIGIQDSDAVIAVSAEMKKDIMKVYDIPEAKISIIHNGIDLNEYRKTTSEETQRQYGIRRPFILFVGRITRQKGIIHLIDALDMLPRDVQVVLCAGAADTPEILAEMESKIKGKDNVVWINEMLPRPRIIELYSAASVFVCPSIYEPFGIINLEAMACETPVVASAVGGIKEVVVPEETGILVEPGNPSALAGAIRRVLDDRELAARFARAGRKRVEAMFSWDSIADRTIALYERLLA